MAFAVWLTGLPASGKSSIAAVLARRMVDLGLPLEVLESDRARTILTPSATYSEAERDLFYRALAFAGSRLVAHQVNLIFDATANLRVHRELARALIPQFLEVWVECPLELCQARDYKGTYRAAEAGRSATVPGLGSLYQAPLQPELRLDSSRTLPAESAARIIDVLRQRGLWPGPPTGA